MGIKLLIFLALVIGVLYCIHLLVKDYQAVTAGTRILRFLFKRDLNSTQVAKAHVRWKKILRHDPLQCARVIFCYLGAESNHTHVQKGFIYMLSIEPRDEDQTSMEDFVKAYSEGLITREPEVCRRNYSLCPFGAGVLFEFVDYLLHPNPMFKFKEDLLF